MKSLVENLSLALKKEEPLPPFETNFDMRTAYQIQQEVTSRVYPSELIGLKAGVTSNDMQTSLGITKPLIGSLFEANKLPPRPRIPYREGRLIECELAVISDHKGNVHAIAAAIEFAVIGFQRKNDLNGPNLVAGNVAVEKFLLGTRYSDINLLQEQRVELFHEENLVNSSDLNISLGGATNAASFIADEASRRNYVIPDRCIFLTGACGKVFPGAHGKYLATFGALGELHFEIV